MKSLYWYLVYMKGYTREEAMETCIRKDNDIEISEEIAQDIQEYYHWDGSEKERLDLKEKIKEAE